MYAQARVLFESVNWVLGCPKVSPPFIGQIHRANVEKTNERRRNLMLKEVHRVLYSEAQRRSSACVGCRALLGCIRLFMLQDVDELPERVANVESTYTPRLAYRPVLNGHVRFFEPR